MPGTINGIGTGVCKAGDDVGFGCDDATECFVFAFLPIIPIRPIHIIAWEGKETLSGRYAAMPLRWSWYVISQSFLRRWFYGFIFIGCAFIVSVTVIIIGFKKNVNPNVDAKGLWIIGAIFLSPLYIGLAGQLLLSWRARRRRNIKLLLGRHSFGNSDPVDWRPEAFTQVGPATELYGTQSFEVAAMKLIRERKWPEAMNASRLCAAIEDRFRGEGLTSDILENVEARQTLQEIRAQLKSAKQLSS